MQSKWYFSMQHCILGIIAVWWAKPQQKQSNLYLNFLFLLRFSLGKFCLHCCCYCFLSLLEVALFFLVYS